MNEIETLKEFFIGTYDKFGIGKFNPETEKTIWKTEEGKLSDDILNTMLENKNYYLGIYPYYQNIKKKDIPFKNFRCKWICIDLDIHDKKLSVEEYRKKLEEELPKLREKIEILFSRSKEYFLCERDYLFLEESLHGFHIWIFLKEDTLYKYAYMFASQIQSRLATFFNKRIEIFPKNETLTKEGFGNFIRCPKNRQFLKNEFKRLDCSSIIQELERELKDTQKNPKSPIGKKLVLVDNIYTPEQIKILSSNFPNTLSERLETYCNAWYGSKCVVNVLKGLQCNGAYGHLMRYQVVCQLNEDKFSKEEIIGAFINQDDYNPKITEYQVNHILKGKYKGFQCKTIEKMGYCDKTCYKCGAISSKINKKEEMVQEIHSWEELGKKTDKLINSQGKFFLLKTTRSGTTTQVILSCLKQKKKLLMIAPTKRIFEETVKKAQSIAYTEKGLSYPMVFRIASNKDMCRIIGNQYKDITDLGYVFPFLLKPMCSKCNLKDTCKSYEFLDNIDKYDIIYLTTQKYKALVGASKYSERAKYILTTLMDWSDIIFIDELNHILAVNSKTFQVYGRYKRYTTYVDFLRITERAIEKIKENDIKAYNQDVLLQAIEDYVLNVLSEAIQDLNQSIEKSKTISLEKYDKIYKSRIEPLIQISDLWIRTFTNLFNAYKNTKEKGIKHLVDLLLALSSKSIYLQKRKPRDYVEPMIEIGYVDDIETLFKHLDNLQVSTIIMTDAVEPSINIKKVFKDLEFVNINDPRKTSEKQIIIVCGAKDYTYSITNPYSQKKIRDFIKEYGKSKNTIIFNANKDKSKEIEKILEREGFRKDEISNCYFRDTYTYGVESDMRVCLVIGSPYPPRHVYDFLAQEYSKLGLIPEGDYKALGKKLENYDAFSTFFQAVSRAKDPYGNIESEVFVLGISKEEIETWFNLLDISTPKVMDIKEYEEWIKNKQKKTLKNS